MTEHRGPYWKGGPAEPPFHFDLNGHELTVPEVATGWWIGALSGADWPAIVALLDEANDDALTGPDSPHAVDAPYRHVVACTAAEIAAGCPWSIAVRLADYIVTDGLRVRAHFAMTSPGLNVLTSPLHMVLAAALAVFLDDYDGTTDEAWEELADPTDTCPPPTEADGMPLVSWPGTDLDQLLNQEGGTP